MDLRNILHEPDEKIPSKKDTGKKNINIHKKPVQLRDIENRSANNRVEKVSENDKCINELIQNEQKMVYNQSWNKLDKGLKINRLKDFVQRDGNTRSLKHVQKDELKQLLISACKNNRLNRLSDINYNIEEGRIESIKVLDYNEASGYILKLPEIKPGKISGKSKSNIERFIRK
jgi:hypothetical protein